MRRLGLQSERGATLVGGVVSVIIGGAVGFYVVVLLLGGLDTSNFTTAQNTTFQTYLTNTNTAFVLIALLAIGLAASGIMNIFG